MGRTTGDLRIEAVDLPYVPVMVNDTGPYAFLLDTGALGASLSSDVARVLGLEEEGWVTLGSLAIGTRRWTDLGLGSGDNSPISKLVGRQVDGILGSRFFAWAGLAVTIDYPNQALCLDEDPRNAAPLPPGIPLHIANCYPLVPVHLDDTGPYLFLLDTGASLCVVSPEVARILELPVGPAGIARGATSDIASRTSRLGRLSVGDTHTEDLKVIVMDCSGVTENAGVQVDGYLGHDWLKRFVVTIDYARSTLILREARGGLRPETSTASG
jgi:hypothetical protein